jgi:hypothetical protein
LSRARATECALVRQSGRFFRNAAIGFSRISWTAAPVATPVTIAAMKTTGPGRESTEPALATTEIATILWIAGRCSFHHFGSIARTLQPRQCCSALIAMQKRRPPLSPSVRLISKWLWPSASTSSLCLPAARSAA